MTFIYELELNILQIVDEPAQCLPNKELSKVRALQTNTQAEATENITMPHSKTEIKTDYCKEF